VRARAIRHRRSPPFATQCSGGSDSSPSKGSSTSLCISSKPSRDRPKPGGSKPGPAGRRTLESKARWHTRSVLPQVLDGLMLQKSTVRWGRPAHCIRRPGRVRSIARTRVSIIVGACPRVACLRIAAGKQRRQVRTMRVAAIVNVRAPQSRALADRGPSQVRHWHVRPALVPAVDVSNVRHSRFTFPSDMIRTPATIIALWTSRPATLSCMTSIYPPPYHDRRRGDLTKMNSRNRAPGTLPSRGSSGGDRGTPGPTK
jgi:hypothetical protein